MMAAGCAIVFALAARYGHPGPPFVPERIWTHIRPGYHLPEVGRALVDNFGWHYNNWLLVGPLCAVALPVLAIALCRRAESVAALFGLLLLAAYLYQFCIGGAYEFLVVPTAGNRSFLRIAPSLLFATALLVSGIVAQETAKKAEGTECGKG